MSTSANFQQLKVEPGNQPVTVIKKIGEGGQGAVFLVNTEHGERALKWYNREQSTEDQKKAILYLVRRGSPSVGGRFLWPEAVVVDGASCRFGYLMPVINKKRYAELGEIQSGARSAPSLDKLCRISRLAAQSYRVLHLAGLCYRDISQGNLLFDPDRGELLICDNDNVGIDQASVCQVQGTMEFMAPELLTQAEKPSTLTDQHSLAVLLFNLWVWHHPMHGQMEYNIRSWDIPAKKKVYGENPVFIFDPSDSSNALPADPDYKIASDRWRLCPKSLQALFIKAFTTGLKSPSRRVTEGEWERCFLRLEDSSLDCSECHANNLFDETVTGLSCWHCKKTIVLPARLAFTSAVGGRQILLNINRHILKRHIQPSGSDGDGIIGEVVQNPANPSILGIRNLGATPWEASFPDGSIKEIPPQRACPLNLGTRINFAGTVAEIIA